MVVDEAGCLHVRVKGRGADKLESSRFEAGREFVRLGRSGRPAVLAPTVEWCSANPVPEVVGETLAVVLPKLEQAARVVKRGVVLQSVANHGGIREKGCPIRICRPHQGLSIKSFKLRPQGFALIQNGSPREPGLKRFEHQVLKHGGVVVHGDAPFSVVVDFHQGVACAPRTFLNLSRRG